MHDYEILLMIDPELPEDTQGEIVTRTRELVEKDGGTWEDHQPWGRRRLAYEIDHKPEGVYHLLTFTCEPTALDEIARVLKITDGVMRHMATRRPRPHRRGEAPPAPPAPPAPAASPEPRADSAEPAEPEPTASEEPEPPASEGEE